LHQNLNSRHRQGFSVPFQLNRPLVTIRLQQFEISGDVYA